MRKLTILFAIITLFAYGHVNGQQIKRNMIANAGFEEGLKHWLRGGNGVTFGEETENPISGTKSAKITVNQTHELLWGNTLKYFLPIKNGKRYKVSFKAKASANVNMGIEFTLSRAPWTLVKSGTQALPGFTPVNVSGNAFRSNLQPEDLCGTFPITTETTVYNFITNEAHLTDWNYALTFCFGKTAASTTVWLDDVRAEIVNEDDNWDGNLFPYGDFEEGITPLLWQGDNDLQNFRIEKASDRLDTWEVSDVEPLGGQKSLLIERKSGNGVFWNFVLLFQYRAIEEVRSQVFFDIKSSQEGWISTRLASEPWDRPVSGDHLIRYVKITSVPQTIELSPDTKTGGNNSATGFYSLNPDWYGKMKVFTSFTEGTDQFPIGAEIRIDNIVVKEYGLKTENFDIVNAPTRLSVNATQQLSIANVYPTHAPAGVMYSVDNPAVAEINPTTGVLKGLIPGTVVVTASSADGNTDKQVTVEITDTSTGIEVGGDNSVYLYPTSVHKGNVVEIHGVNDAVDFTVFDITGKIVLQGSSKYINTAGFNAGIYIVKTEDGSNTIRRFSVR